MHTGRSSHWDILAKGLHGIHIYPSPGFFRLTTMTAQKEQNKKAVCWLEKAILFGHSNNYYIDLWKTSDIPYINLFDSDIRHKPIGGIQYFLLPYTHPSFFTPTVTCNCQTPGIRIAHLTPPPGTSKVSKFCHPPPVLPFPEGLPAAGFFRDLREH